MAYAYRFRTIESLLGKHGELEHRQIYFSTLSDLNDPMEGFLNIRWKGDIIVWKNLIRHFLLCLEHVFGYCLIAGINDQDPEIKIPVFKTFDDLPTDIYKDQFSKLEKIFFADPGIARLLELLARRNTSLSQRELCWHLSSIHMFALSKIQEVYIMHGLIPKDHPAISLDPVDSASNDQIFSGLNHFSQSPENLEALVDVSYFMHQQTRLLARLQAADVKSTPTRNLLIHTFVEAYLKQIGQILFPDRYIACFSHSHTNPSMWAHYAAAHTGVCLKFRVDDDEYGKSLKLAKGSSVERHKLHTVQYEAEYPELDFFRSIGRLNVSKLKKFWYSDNLGAISECASDVFENEENWRKNYWESQIIASTIKLNDWRHEEELRIVRTDTLSELSSPENRVLNYEFSSLEGIVFGMNTRYEDMLEVIKIIEQQCREHVRSDFKFYQSYYSKKSGKIEAYELRLLKFQL